MPWIVQPWVAAGALTQVVGKPKTAGKSTWVLRLVRAVLEANSFMDQPTSWSPVVLLSEEGDATLRPALERADLLNRSDLIVLQWRDTLGVPWEDVIAAAVGKCEQLGAKLLIVDTVSQFAVMRGDTENNSGDAFEVFGPLQGAAARGLGVIAIRHQRKSGGDVSDAGRGSSAFAGAADVVLTIQRVPGMPDTFREIRAVSRLEDIPSRVVVELTDEGYVVQEAGAALIFNQTAAKLLEVAPSSAEDAKTLDELMKLVAAGRTTTQNAVDQHVNEGRLRRVGRGTRGSPYRYYKPEILSAGTHPLKRFS